VGGWALETSKIKPKLWC